MQVATQNSLTWLQTTPAAVTAADQISSAYGQISPGDDASGADSGQGAISALQSPAQMFSSASLDSLISAQSDGRSTDAASSASPTPTPPPGRHHHHHGADAPPAADSQDASGVSSAAATPAATASDTAGASALAGLSQVLTSM